MKKFPFLISLLCFLMTLNKVSANAPAKQLKNSIDAIFSIINNPELKGDNHKDERRALTRRHFRESFSFSRD